MPKNDDKIAAAARRFVKALEDLDREGGDHATMVDKRRQELEAAIRAEEDDK